MKRIKFEANNNNDNNDTDNGVIWLNNKNNNNNFINKDDIRPATAATNRPTTANFNVPRESTLTSSPSALSAFSCTHTVDERKVKLLNKTVKLKSEISKLQKENVKMKQVIYQSLSIVTCKTI